MAPMTLESDTTMVPEIKTGSVVYRKKFGDCYQGIVTRVTERDEGMIATILFVDGCVSMLPLDQLVEVDTAKDAPDDSCSAPDVTTESTAMNEYMMTILVKVHDCSAGDAVIGLQDLFREQNPNWIIGDPVITVDVTPKDPQ